MVKNPHMVEQNIETCYSEMTKNPLKIICYEWEKFWNLLFWNAQPCSAEKKWKFEPIGNSGEFLSLKLNMSSMRGWEETDKIPFSQLKKVKWNKFETLLKYISI